MKNSARYHHKCAYASM